MAKRFLPGCTLLLAIAVLVFVVGPAGAAKKAAGPFCGDYVSGSVKLTKNLKCDGTNGLNVNDDGTTIDLAGYSITCVDSCEFGIYNDGYDNVTIMDTGKKGKPTKKGVISNFGFGIFLDHGSEGNVVKGLQIQNSEVGIYNDDGFGNAFLNNSIFDVGTGVYLYDDHCFHGSHTVSGNIVAFAEYAYWNYNDCSDSNGHNLFSNNQAYYSYAGFYDQFGFMEMWKNNTATYTDYGFLGDFMCMSTWDGNTSKFAYYDGFDIYGNHFCPVTVTNNTATKTGNGPGFYFEKLNWGSDGSTISGNTSSKNYGPGFAEYRNYYADWTGNTAMKNGVEGFYLDHTFEETITGNTATGNGFGAPAAGFYVNNNFSPNGCDGGNQCQVNDLSGNTANSNSFFGIFADQSIVGDPNGATGNGTGQCFNVACTPSLAPVHFAGSYPRAGLTFSTQLQPHVGAPLKHHAPAAK